MTTRKRYCADFKAKVAHEAIREALTLSEPSKKYDAPPNMIGTWQRAAVETMATALSKGKEIENQTNAAEIEKLHGKIGQLVVERDFLSQATVVLGVNGGKKR